MKSKRGELSQAETKKRFIQMLSRYLRRKNVEVTECTMRTEPIYVGANSGGMKVFAPSPEVDIHIHITASRDVATEWEIAMREVM